MESQAVTIRESDGQRNENAWRIITELVLDGIASSHTRRAYSQALEEFLIWFQDEAGRVFNKATVQKYRAELESKGLAASSVNVRLSAIRRLALEAADNGMMALELSAGIARAKGVKRCGVRFGRWLTAEQAERLLAFPDCTTIKGLRDRAVLSLLLGAGLRRSELAGLNVDHFQKREGRWILLNLTGKHGRVRSVPIPDWTYASAREWSEAAAITVGAVFRSITRHGHVIQRRISPQAVFEIVKTYAQMLNAPIGPHDLRRSFARLAHLGQAPLEQIQLSLGHASVITTELYLGVKQNLIDAPCDRLGLNPSSSEKIASGDVDQT